MDSLISMQGLSSVFTCLMHTYNSLVTASLPEEGEVARLSWKGTRHTVECSPDLQSPRGLQSLGPQGLTYSPGFFTWEMISCFLSSIRTTVENEKKNSGSILSYKYNLGRNDWACGFSRKHGLLPIPPSVTPFLILAESPHVYPQLNRADVYMCLCFSSIAFSLPSHSSLLHPCR